MREYMSLRSRHLGLLLAVFLFGGAAAHAATITFDDVQDGTTINMVYGDQGVVFGCLKGKLGSCSNVARAAAAPNYGGGPAYSPPNVVTVAVHNAYRPAFNERDGYATAHFLSPVKTVSIYAKPYKPGAYASNNRPFLQAFDANNKWLATVNYPTGARWGTWQKLVISRPTNDIQYVVFSSYASLSAGAVYGVFDNLEFSPNPAAQWSAIAAGNAFSVGLKTDGSLWTWGKNNHGQLGSGNTTDANSPYHVGTSTWSAAAAGSEHTVAIRKDGTMWGWGWNGSGEVGDGSTMDRYSPAQVGSFNDWLQVAAGADHTLAVRKDPAQSTDRNSLWTWGGNGLGQVGDGTANNQPSPVPLNIFQVRAASGGDSFSIAVLVTPPQTFAWGYNGFGQLGDGSTTNRNTPEWLVDAYGSNAGTFDHLSVGSGHVAALRYGTLWTWGLNGHGQLGNGTTGDQHRPAQVPGSTIPAWTAVAAGGQHTVGIKTDGTLWAWGWNAYGQLGDGTTNDRPAPVQIGTGSNWVAVAAGFAHTLAIKADGTLWAWGLNDRGQLGDRSAINRPSPVQVSN